MGLNSWHQVVCHGYNEYFVIEKHFNGIKYRLEISPHVHKRTVYCYVSLSSGKKRKDLKIFMDKGYKNNGVGISALLWAKRLMLSFPDYYQSLPGRDHKNKKVYIAINWSDNRRRDIYSRLKQQGFIFMNTEFGKSLVKQWT